MCQWSWTSVAGVLVIDEGAAIDRQDDTVRISTRRGRQVNGRSGNISCLTHSAQQAVGYQISAMLFKD
jgi:hypothetical protein